MALRKVSLLFAFAVIIGGGFCSAKESNFEDKDPEWPAGISPLDSLSFWSDDEDTEDGENTVEVDDSNGCCLPRTWTGRLFTEVRREGGRTRATPGPGLESRTLRFVQVLYVDQPNNRIAQDVIIRRRRNATTISSILLFSNSSATLYTFSKAAKKCAKKVLKGAQFRPQCIPANATLQGSFALGAGPGALQSQSWGYLYRDRRVVIASNVILTPGNCVPVLAAERVITRPRMSVDPDKKKKKPQITNIGALYTDVKATIADPSVFTPPSYCKKEEDSTLAFDPDVDVTTIIERYVAVP